MFQMTAHNLNLAPHKVTTQGDITFICAFTFPGLVFNRSWIHHDVVSLILLTHITHNPIFHLFLWNSFGLILTYFYRFLLPL